MIFRCEIEMHNEAMQTTQDLVGALKAIIKQVEFYSAGIVEVALNVRDENGNKCGDWSLTEE